MKRISILLVIAFLQGCIFTGDKKAHAAADPSAHEYKDKKEKKDGKKKDGKEKNEEKNFISPEVAIVQKWELPAELTEISGLAYIDKDRFACVQDEAAKIYIYNKTTRKIERVIPFGGAGDYEGIAIVGNTAYIVRSDGMLYEVSDIRTEKSVVKSYKTPLTAEQNVEGLCYDKTKNRLLLAIKNTEPGTSEYKGIYEFNIRTKSLTKTPAYKIYLEDEILNAGNTKKKSKPVMPSGIVRHPGDQNLYILDGPSSGLLVMNQSGKLTEHYVLGRDFAKPEGITFSPEGSMYVSNEGKKQAPNIIEVRLSRKASL